MSKILIVLGREKSAFAKGTFNEGLAAAARDFLTGAGHEVQTTDILDAWTVEAEIAKFKWAEAVIYQYPIYWFMMPPSLKRYIDEVYAYGAFFGFNDKPYGQGGLLPGKKLMLSTTWNAPADAFGDPAAFFEGATVDAVLLPMRKAHTYCGFEELPHFSSHDVIKNADFAADKARFLAHLGAVFAPAATAAA